MPIVGFLLDAAYDFCVFEFCKDQKEFGLWYYAAARIAWVAIKWIVTPHKRVVPVTRTLPQLYDFTLDEQKAILEASNKIPSWVHFPDIERAEWVNVVVARVWSPFGRYMDRLFKEWLEPIIQTAIGNKISFKFDKVDLGSIPARLSGVKGYRENVDRREIILDWEIYYSGDAELTVYVSGIKAGVKNIQLRGTLRVVLKPVLMDMPFLGGVEVYFLNPPVIDFDMTNLLNAPGFSALKQTVHQTVMDNLKLFTVLPNKISIPFTDISYKDFMFDLPAGMLRVHVIAGKNLPVADLALIGSGTSDPYVRVYLGAKEVKTKTKLKTVNPTWDEVYDFIVSEPQGQLLNLELYDEDVRQDDFLGSVAIDSGQVRTGEEPAVHWYNISGGSKGQIHLKLSWFELSSDRSDLAPTMHENKLLSQYAETPLSAAILLVLIDSAENLQRVVASGKDRDPNAGAAVSVGHQMFTTRTVPHTSSPVWEQQILFYVHNPSTENLIVLIRDDASVLPLGSLEFPLATLLEADNFAMEHPFPLKGSGPYSTVKLRMVLRIATNSEVRSNYFNTGLRTDFMNPTSLALPPPTLPDSTDNLDLDSDGYPLRKTKSLNPISANFRAVPRISIALSYKTRSNELTLELIEACALDALWELAKHAREKVFVICAVLPTKQKYHSGDGSSVDNPTFREKFDFSLGGKLDVKNCTLHLKVVWGSRMFNDVLGEVKIPLKFLNLSDRLSAWYELTPRGADGVSVKPLQLTVPGTASNSKLPSTSSSS